MGVCVSAHQRSIALFLSGGQVHAIDDVCPHRGGALSEGDLEHGTVACPLHGWTFELATGAMCGNPAVAIPTYEVEIRDGDIYVGPPRRV